MYIVSQNGRHIVKLRKLDFIEVDCGITNEIMIVNRIDEDNYDILGYCDTWDEYYEILNDIAVYIAKGYGLYRMD